MGKKPMSIAGLAEDLATRWLDARVEFAEETGRPVTWDYDVHDAMETVERVTRSCGVRLSVQDLCALTEMVVESIRAKLPRLLAATSERGAS